MRRLVVQGWPWHSKNVTTVTIQVRSGVSSRWDEELHLHTPDTQLIHTAVYFLSYSCTCRHQSVQNGSTVSVVLLAPSDLNTVQPYKFSCDFNISVPVLFTVSLQTDLRKCLTNRAITLTADSNWRYGCWVREVAFNQQRVTTSFASRDTHLHRFPQFTLWFDITPVPDLPVVSDSAVSGYIQLPLEIREDDEGLAQGYTHLLTVPAGHSVFVSMQPRKHMVRCRTARYLLYVRHNIALWEVRQNSLREIALHTERLYNHSLLILHTPHKLDIRLHVKIRFSIHYASQVPHVLSLERENQSRKSQYDCSEAWYSQFKEHFFCDSLQDCQDGRDEPPDLCPLLTSCENHTDVYIDSVNRRFWYHVYHKPYESSNTFLEDWHEANQQCTGFNISRPTDVSPDLQFIKSTYSMQNYLPMIKRHRDWEDIAALTYTSSSVYFAFTGLTYHPAQPRMYANMWTWVDGTVSYFTNVSLDLVRDVPVSVRDVQYRQMLGTYVTRASFGQRILRIIQPTTPGFTILHHFRSLLLRYTNCQTPDTRHKHYDPIQFKDVNNVTFNSNLSLAVCVDGYVIHTFMLCSQQDGPHCTRTRGQQLQGSTCLLRTTALQGSKLTRVSRASDLDSTTFTLPMFECDAGDVVTYSQVCDLRQHCSDGSDEEFCLHSHSCHGGFLCSSGHCLPQWKRCNGAIDCLRVVDDEKGCPFQFIDPIIRPEPPAVIDYSERLGFTYRPLPSVHHCPHTHFLCPSNGHLCLPLYLRCNGMYDCTDHEDEERCAEFTCPGMYRCAGSSFSRAVITNISHTERIRTRQSVNIRPCVHPDHVCDGDPHCPLGDDELLCHFVCPDRCRCVGLALLCPQPFKGDISQARFLDASGSGLIPSDLLQSTPHYLVWLSLSSCGLTTVSFDHFFPLANVLFLSLANNPLQSTVVHRQWKNKNLKHLDLSFTRLETVRKEVLSTYPALEVLNLSFTKLNMFSEDNFQHIFSLHIVDIRSCPIVDIPNKLLHRLTSLQSVYSSNFRICCRSVLPEKFDENFCHYPDGQLASCENLLYSVTYRGCIWVIGFLSIVGNCGCLVFRRVFRRGRVQTGFNVFVGNLHFADFFMGLYLMIVGSADLAYRGQYLPNERSWKNSLTCRLAGVMALTSSEVSALTICLITLDRFIVLRFPFTNIRFKALSAALACLLCWTAAILLALIPLFPSSLHWNFYSQSGICIPLPITRKHFKGKDFSFGVMIVFNFVLFVLIAVGQQFIYRTVVANALKMESTKKAQDLIIARRLITVVVSDFLCWFPIGLLGLMASGGVAVSSELNIVIAIFVLPLNSALNPFIYTFNVVLEKQSKMNESQLLRTLHSVFATDEVKDRDNEAKRISKVKHKLRHEDIFASLCIQYVENALSQNLITASEVQTIHDRIQSTE